jgi:hypothetical protein
MANVTITDLGSAAALTGTEVLAIDQNGSTVKTTTQDVANLASGGSTFDIVTVGTLGTSPLAISFVNVAVLDTVEGAQNVPIVNVPTFRIEGGMSPFTGTLSSISFPTTTIGSITIMGISTVTTIDLPVLERVWQQMMGSSLSFTNNSSLTTLNIPSLVNVGTSPYLFWTNNAFSQATVDHILERMVATGAENGQLNIDGGTSSAPSANGLAAKATLEGRGWSVTTN